MKHSGFVLLFFIAILSFNGNAQDPDSLESIGFDHLRSPTNPGFSILNLEPSVVSRPKTPQKFGVAVLSGISEDNEIPKFAIQTAPYWWKSNPDLTFGEYLNPNLLQSSQQTFSLSMATRQVELRTPGLAGTNMGIGLRFQPLSGRLNEQARRTLDAIRESSELLTLLASMRIHGMTRGYSDTGAIREDFLERLNNNDSIRAKALAKKRVFRIIDTLPFEPDDQKAYFQRLIKGIEKADRQQVLAFQSLDKKRVGWILEVSGASSVNFPESTLDQSQLYKVGGWLNLSYKPEKSSLEFTLLGRYFSDIEAFSNTTLEGGLGLGYARENFTLLLEGLVRNYEHEIFQPVPLGTITKGDSKLSYRLALNFNYRITENIYVTGTLGKAHEKPWAFVNDNNLLSMIGLNLAAPVKSALSENE